MDKLFSFDYGGRPFPESFDRSPQGAEVWVHPSGLTVTVESTSDPDTGAQEWTLWFENRGKADSAPLTNVYPLDARAAFPDGCTVTTAKGTSTPAYVTGGEAFEIAIAETRGSRLIMYRKDGANTAPQPWRS